MPTYVITAPDGVEYEVDAPEGATQEQALERVKAQYSSPQQAPQAPQTQPDSDNYLDQMMSEGRKKDTRALNMLKQVGGGLAQAGMDLVDAPFNIGNVISKGVADFAGAESYPQAMLPSEIPMIKDFISKGTARAIPKGESVLADALRTGTEWGAGLLTNPAKKLPDILAGTGAAIGEQIGGETGEMIGGISGMLGGTKRARKEPKTPSATSEERAINFIMENADNPNVAIANLRLAQEQGEIGSLAELTKDRGIFNVESAAQKGSKLQSDLDDITQLRGEQIIEEVGKPFGSGGDAAKIASARKTELQEPILAQKQQAIAEGEQILPRAQAKVTQAEEAAQKATGDISPTVEPSEASKQLSDTYSKAEADFIKQTEKPAWKDFSDGENLNVDDVKDILKTDLDQLSKTEANILNQKFGAQVNLVRDWDKTVAPDEVHTVVSQIKAINNNAKQNNDFDNANRLLAKMGDSLETSLKELGSKSKYDNAVSVSKEKFDRFSPSRVGKERGKFEPETFARRLLDKNEGGAVVGDLIKAADSPYITKKAEQYIKSIAKKDGVDDAFLKGYDELLNRFPTLKTQLHQVKKTQDNLAEAQKGVLPKTIEAAKAKVKTDADTAAKGLSKSVSNLQINKFKQDKVKFLDNALKGSAEDLTKLNRQMGRVDGGKEALKASIKDRVINKITVGKDGKQTVPFGAIDEFSKVKGNLIESGILTVDEVADIDKALEKASISGLRRKAAVQKADSATTALTDIASSVGALAALALLPASNQLMVAGTFRRLLKNKLESKTVDKKTIEALNDMIINPKNFLKGVSDRKITTEKALDKYLATYINSFSQTVAEEE